MSPEVTVLMSVYNGELFLRESIESILNQTFNDFEYLIINDGSTDSSKDIIESYNDSRIVLYNNEKNRGLTKSLNIGIHRARGVYIARQDADDVSHPERLGKEVQFLSGKPQYAAVGCCINIIDKKSRIKGSIHKPISNDVIHDILKRNNCIAHGSVLIKKRCLFEVDLYDESLGAAQDYDLFMRLSEKYKLANLPDLLYSWRNQSGNVSAKNRQLQNLCVKIAQDKSWRRKRGTFENLNSKETNPTSNPKPLFSLLMANYNNADFIREAIQSVIDQKFKDWELIIVDDFSEDISVQIIMEFLDNKRIRFTRNKQNIGYIATLEKLISMSNANVFGILDSDDVLFSDAIEIMFDAHRKNSGCGLIHSQFMFCDKDLKPISLGFSKTIPRGSSNLKDSHTCAFRTFKREFFNRTEGFDEKILYAEDWDIVFKMEEVAPVLFVDMVLYKHRICPNSQSNDPLKKRIGHLSYSLAKYKAYQRRAGTGIPTLSRNAMSIELFKAFVLSLGLYKWMEARVCFKEAVKLNPFLLLSLFGYSFGKTVLKVKRHFDPNYQSPFPAFSRP
jgi:glycosyltransferase involved in cell wall biosynthesis